MWRGQSYDARVSADPDANPLRDDGVRYGELLDAAGVSAQVHNAQTLVHGYLGYHGVVPVATEAVDRGLAALRAALA